MSKRAKKENTEKRADSLELKVDFSDRYPEKIKGCVRNNLAHR
jgi:hypothetical protein